MSERLTSTKPDRTASARGRAGRLGGVVLLVCALVSLPLAAQEPPPAPSPEPAPALPESSRLDTARALHMEQLLKTMGKELIDDLDASTLETIDKLGAAIGKFEGGMDDLQITLDGQRLILNDPEGALSLDLRDFADEDLWRDIGEEVPEMMPFVLDLIGADEAHVIAEGLSLPDFVIGSRRPQRRVVGDGIFAIAEDVFVKEDERVAGEVVCIGGEAVVMGEVDADVIVLGGDLSIGGDAELHGSVIVIAGDLNRDPDARIDKAIRHFNIGGEGFDLGTLLRGPTGPVAAVVQFVVLMVLTLLMLLFFPVLRRRSIETVLVDRPGRSFGMGLLWLLLGHGVFIVVTAVLVGTVIGIPLAVLGVLCYVLLGFLSLGAVARSLGLRVCGDRCREREGVVAPTVIGLLLISSPLLIGAAIWFWSPSLRLVAQMLMLLGLAANLMSYTFGSGAVFASRLGAHKV